MNTSYLITDNIAEIIFDIIQFTQARQKLLIENINNFQNINYVPKDLSVEEFSGILGRALDEHVRNGRLLMADTENIRYEAGGGFNFEESIDLYAKEMLKSSQYDEYIEYQMDKLLENSLNQRVAAELLKQKDGEQPLFEWNDEAEF